MAIVTIIGYLVALLAVLVWATTRSGAAEALPSASSQPQASAARIGVTAPDFCPSARGAIAFYSRRVAYWRDKMGAPAIHRTPSRLTGCPRYLAGVYRQKARNARRAYERWVDYHWNWRRWLPDKFARVGACETGYGRRPGSWTWDSGTYVSAFGIYRPAYAQFARELGLPTWDDPGRRTPREQYEVAAAIQRRYSWSAWGCGSA